MTMYIHHRTGDLFEDQIWNLVLNHLQPSPESCQIHLGMIQILIQDLQIMIILTYY